MKTSFVFDNLRLSNTKSGLRMTETKDLILQNDDRAELIDFELAILNSEIEVLKEKNRFNSWKADEIKERERRFFESLSRLTGQAICLDDLENKNPKILKWQFCQAVDDAFGELGALIQPSHEYMKFSLIRMKPDLKKYVPDVHKAGVFGYWEGYAIRSTEILREFSAENTSRAFNGDLIYWQAWLSASGHHFNQPITANEIKVFIVQHAEGLPYDVDHVLVEQRYKQSLGPHKIATIKRRLASLSVFLDVEKRDNPIRDFEVRKLLEKITKKYGETRRKGRAITKDILFAILDTCGNSLIDARDMALILFGWASGGRRRSEIADAEIKDLIPDGENFIYQMPRSKTDQKGEGKALPINGMAARCLKEWLARAGVTKGKIFRSVSKGGKVGEKITDVDINRVIKRRCEKAGYDPALYSAHSLRSGFVTEGGRQQCPIGDIMALSGHKSVNVAMRYYQAGSVKNNSAANLV